MNDSNLEKAFIELTKENERLIYKVCSIYVSDEFPLADLYQEVVFNLWKGFSKFRNECSVSTWMYRVALNTCITGMRKDWSYKKIYDANIQSVKKSLEELKELKEE